MKLFQRQEFATPEEGKLSVMRFWFFVLAIFSFVIPAAILFAIHLLGRAMGVSSLWGDVLRPSLVIFVIITVILVVVYFIYRAILLRGK